MDYFLALLVNGLLSGAVYALVGVAFVVVFRASGVLNFSLGEWVGVGARLTGALVQSTGAPLIAAIAAAAAFLAILAAIFNQIVIRKLIGRPVVAVVMATLALGLLMRGGAAIALGGVPTAIPFPFGEDVWRVGPLILPYARMLASAVAIVLVLAAIAFFRLTRAGVALRAIADDPQAATALGVSVVRYLALAWAMSAVLGVAGGVLWRIDGLGGFGMGLVLAKVLPVVVIGGLTSFAGAIFGATLVGVAESMAAGYLDPLVGTGTGGLIAAALVILTLWVRPTGLFGAAKVERV